MSRLRPAERTAMGTILLCADSASLADPPSLGLDGRAWSRRTWLEAFSNAAAARDRLSQGDPVEEAWVASSDQMDAVNLAAALRRDAPSIPIYLVSESLSGSAISRAQAAGITGMLSPEGLARRVAHEERRRLGAAARAAALRAAEASTRPDDLSGETPPTVSVRRPLPGIDELPREPELLGEEPAPESSPALARMADAPQAPAAEPLGASRPPVPEPPPAPSSPTALSAADTAPLPPVAVGGSRRPEPPVAPAIAAASPSHVVAVESCAAKAPAYVVSVVSGSGGAGKSAVAVLSACLAAARGLRVLLVDGDLQFGDAADLLGASDAPTVDEVLADPRRLDTLVGEGVPALVAAPRRPERAEELAGQLPCLMEAASTRFDVVFVNTGSSWSEAQAVVIERSARTLFLVDQRASSVRACRHALELCERCGIATGSFLFLLNRCAKGAPLTALDVSCALQGAPVTELRDGGTAVEELLGSGMAAALAAERNELCASLSSVIDGLLPDGEAGGGLRGRKGRRVAPPASESAASDAPDRRRGRTRSGRKSGLWGRRPKASVAIESGAER